MVIGDLRVVDEARPSGRSPVPGASESRVRPSIASNDLRQRPRDVLRQVPAVRARIADQLVLLVQRLRDVQRPLRAEAE